MIKNHIIAIVIDIDIIIIIEIGIDIIMISKHNFNHIMDFHILHSFLNLYKLIINSFFNLKILLIYTFSKHFIKNYNFFKSFQIIFSLCF